MRRTTKLLAAALPMSVSGVASAFDAPKTYNPLTSGVVATFDSSVATASLSLPLRLDINNPFTQYPDLYYVKYHSDGNTIVKFDTLGSDFGDRGPLAQIPTAFRGAYNNGQMIVYRADGSKVAISKATTGTNGDPIVTYPRTSSSESQWYVGEGLSEMYFYNGAPAGNPHWNASPSDPNYYAGWSAPGNPGNSQRYYQPYYPTNLNEYHVWSTALSHYVLDNNNNVVYNSDGTPKQQPGWRFSDYARVGPASSFSRYQALPAGDYYIGFSAAGLVFSGDTYTVQYLQAPVNYDYDTNQNYQSALGPEGLGPWQYYTDSHGGAAYGTIAFNLTQISSTIVNSSWKSNAGGAWSATTNWSGAVPNGIEQYANFGTFNGTITAPQSVNLDSPMTVGAVTFDNNASYTLGGATITLDVLISDRAAINVLSGNHTISSPIVLNDDTNINVVPAGSTLNVSGAITSQLKLVEKTGAGVAQLASLSGFGLTVAQGKVRLSEKPAANSSASSVRQLVIGAGAQLDLTNNSFILDWNGTKNDNTGEFSAPHPELSEIRQLLLDQRIITSATTGGNAVGYVSNLDTHLSSYSGYAFPANDFSQYLFKFTYSGDANLDSTVTTEDFTALAANFAQSSNSFWAQGDFNYDGIVNAMDFNILASNFGKGTLSPLGSAPALGTLVPEPALATLLIGAGILAHHSRRRTLSRRGS